MFQVGYLLLIHLPLTHQWYLQAHLIIFRGQLLVQRMETRLVFLLATPSPLLFRDPMNPLVFLDAQRVEPLVAPLLLVTWA